MTTTEPPTIVLVAGTRPELIKVAPVAMAIDGDDRLRRLLLTTGQHAEVVTGLCRTFGLRPDLELGAMPVRPRSLDEMAGTMLERVGAKLDETTPDAVLVQGDTTSTMVAALAALHRRIPVVHLEAGLRTGDLYAPFPEEANRRIVSAVASLHLAPTEGAAVNLLREAVAPASVTVTGNTVVDALNWIQSHDQAGADHPVLARLRSEGIGRWTGDGHHEAVPGSARLARTPLVLVTLHRRESWGSAVDRVIGALRRIAAGPDAPHLLVVTHPNPRLREVFEAAFHRHGSVSTVGPMSYPSFVHAMGAADVILTDSGGVQEEAPALGTPVVVMRDTTERPEAVMAGAATLVGTDPDRIVTTTRTLLAERSGSAWACRDLFGDGRAAARVVDAVVGLLGRRATVGAVA